MKEQSCVPPNWLEVIWFLYTHPISSCKLVLWTPSLLPTFAFIKRLPSTWRGFWIGFFLKPSSFVSFLTNSTWEDHDSCPGSRKMFRMPVTLGRDLFAWESFCLHFARFLTCQAALCYVSHRVLYLCLLSGLLRLFFSCCSRPHLLPKCALSTFSPLQQIASRFRARRLVSKSWHWLHDSSYLAYCFCLIFLHPLLTVTALPDFVLTVPYFIHGSTSAFQTY